METIRPGVISPGVLVRWKGPILCVDPQQTKSLERVAQQTKKENTDGA